MAKQTNINYRQRLIELYNIHRIKTAKALDAWRKDNKKKKAEFRPEEWKETDLHKAMQMHENQTNLLYIKQFTEEKEVAEAEKIKWTFSFFLHKVLSFQMP